MSQPSSWYEQLQVLSRRYGEDIVFAAEQHLAARFADRPREEWLAAIEHLAALRMSLGAWDVVERIARSIASGRPPHVETTKQRVSVAVMPGTGQRGRRGAPVLIEVMSLTAGYVTLATRCNAAIPLSPKGQRGLEASGTRFVHELVTKTVDELSRIDGITAEDLAAIIRFCDKFGLPLGARLDTGVIEHIRGMASTTR